MQQQPWMGGPPQQQPPLPGMTGDFNAPPPQQPPPPTQQPGNQALYCIHFYIYHVYCSFTFML